MSNSLESRQEDMGNEYVDAVPKPGKSCRKATGASRARGVTSLSVAGSASNHLLCVYLLVINSVLGVSCFRF